MEQNSNYRYLLHIPGNGSNQETDPADKACRFPTFSAALLALLDLPYDESVRSVLSPEERTSGQRSAQIIDLASGRLMAYTSTEENPVFGPPTVLIMYFLPKVLERYFPDLAGPAVSEHTTKFVPILAMDEKTSSLYPTDQCRLLAEAAGNNVVAKRGSLGNDHWQVTLRGQTGHDVSADGQIAAQRFIEIHSFETEKEALIKLLTIPGVHFDQHLAETVTHGSWYERADIGHSRMASNAVSVVVVPPSKPDIQTGGGRFLLAEDGWKSVVWKLGVPKIKRLERISGTKVLKLDYWTASAPPSLMPTSEFIDLFDSVKNLEERTARNQYRLYRHFETLAQTKPADAVRPGVQVIDVWHSNDLLALLYAMASSDWRKFDRELAMSHGLDSTCSHIQMVDWQDHQLLTIYKRNADTGKNVGSGVYVEFSRHLRAEPLLRQLGLDRQINLHKENLGTHSGRNAVMLIDLSAEQPRTTPFFQQMLHSVTMAYTKAEAARQPQGESPSQVKPFELQMDWVPTEPGLTNAVMSYTMRYDELERAMEIAASVPLELMERDRLAQDGSPVYLRGFALKNQQTGTELVLRRGDGTAAGILTQLNYGDADPSLKALYDSYFGSRAPSPDRARTFNPDSECRRQVGK